MFIIYRVIVFILSFLGAELSNRVIVEGQFLSYCGLLPALAPIGVALLSLRILYKLEARPQPVVLKDY